MASGIWRVGLTNVLLQVFLQLLKSSSDFLEVVEGGLLHCGEPLVPLREGRIQPSVQLNLGLLDDFDQAPKLVDSALQAAELVHRGFKSLDLGHRLLHVILDH